MAFDVERRCVHHLLEQRVRENPSARLLTIIGETQADSFTRAEIWDLAKCVATSYRVDGVVPGDRVVIMVSNRIEFVSAWLGALAVGAIPVPLNTLFAGPILANMLVTMTPAAVVIESTFVDGVAPALREVGFIGSVAVVGAPPSLHVDGLKAVDFATWQSAAPTDDIHQAEPQDTASLLYTSGTTGPSKGCMWPHRMFLYNAEAWAEMIGHEKGDVIHCAAPLFHGLSLMACFLSAMLISGEAVIPVRFSVTDYWKQIHDFGVTRGVVVGQMMTLLERQPVADYEVDNTLKSIFCGPVPANFAELEARFGFRLCQGYGLSDVGTVIGQPRDEDGFDKTCMGKALPDWELQLVDDDDKEVPVGEPGELIARPRKPWIASKGYFGMPEATVEMLQNAWYHTGDVLRCDDDGWYHFVDRKKDALRRGGENISSFEVEQVLLRHRNVRDVAVVAVPSDLTEDDVMAYVVVDPETELTDVGDFAEANLPYFAVPRYFEVIEELPLTPTNKVRKVELRERGVTSATWDRGRTRRKR